MKTFNVPVIYRSPLISAIKQQRKQEDRMKKDFTPTALDFGPLKILLARHFGFCYGVENAIEIAFKTVDENPDKRIFLLSEMIHNPHVNNDLLDRGVRFIMDTAGNQLVPWEALVPDDIVIIPAFGTTIETENHLASLGIEPLKYNTTCPFVERVWNKAEQIGKKNYTVIVHGKPKHEETRATFSHSQSNTPTIVIKDIREAEQLAAFIKGEGDPETFYTLFKGQYSPGFNVATDLQRVGVVNQTTMLATETQAIADYIRQVMIATYDLTEETAGDRFADTRDTLCYATNDNQTAVTGMLQEAADLAIVVGGYNSSNTSHLVELCEEKLPTYFISAAEHMVSAHAINHWDFHHKKELHSAHFLPEKEQVTILLTSGASCPDALVEGVIRRLLSFYQLEHKADELVTI
ncbi:4-hydroxy-3-methylbut-2-enyl diphosphate reductase [Chitinophaga nivalis]|uniref:4-hydroxy-3-methylbut-2-enyl diphosphate reductase n=1 Tax=Chitinophaga nivalis TaxID=2991709 RepID=A0ABT3IS92_9BACT|nr:4-hydroxy-3-methylbut-2-enyl diphosphate reductase [Chitinophaga nivalis]MCW3463554.1 4-hydroxy-3-methylbut-2-enyl diphosphate reductase [Chitinophaga nivalis]MCW3486756.1 4-hydroxy-3-methylbut-2-enyl diphosphate reductase [Chitinophaga nivalis]